MATNFEAVTGDHFNLNLAFTDANGAAVNISTYESIKCTLKAHPGLADNATGVVTKTASIVSGVGGTALVAFTPDDTEDLVGSYFYDVQYVDGSGTVKTAMTGVITFVRDITRTGAA